MKRPTLGAIRERLGLTGVELSSLLQAAKLGGKRIYAKHGDLLEEVLLLYLYEMLSWSPAKRAVKIRAIRRALKNRGKLGALGFIMKEIAEPLLRRSVS
jgi:hypothetical protein